MVTLTDIALPSRALIAVWFLLVCPGMAFVRLLQLQDQASEWTIAIALSLALDAAVAIIMVYGGIWSPDSGLRALILISLVGALMQFWAAVRMRRKARGVVTGIDQRRPAHPIITRLEYFLIPTGTGLGTRALRLLLFSLGVFTFISGLTLAALVAFGVFTTLIR